VIVANFNRLYLVTATIDPLFSELNLYSIQIFGYDDTQLRPLCCYFIW